MSSLTENESEMQIFMDEMLSAFGIRICEKLTQEEIRGRLTMSSFSVYLNFIGSIEVIIKEMGS
jgi:hypothetical protein